MKAYALAAAAGLGGAAALAARALWIEPRRLELRRLALAVPGWTEELDGLRVAIVADLHTGAPHVDERRVEDVVARVNAERPDLVTLLGDFVDESVSLAQPVPAEAVAARLATLEAPLGRVAVLGNHDWQEGGRTVAAALRDAGIPVLENEAVELPRGLWVAGLADAHERVARIGAALEAVPGNAPCILLSHNPDVFPRVPASVSLTLAGHTHGTQLNVPLLRGRAVPSRFGLRYAGGHVEEDGRQMYVSRGVGTSGLPLRFRAPPEIAVIELSRSGDGASSSGPRTRGGP
jgi:predicted MPP superfamily phosphohydrolase